MTMTYKEIKQARKKAEQMEEESRVALSQIDDKSSFELSEHSCLEVDDAGGIYLKNIDGMIDEDEAIALRDALLVLFPVEAK